ncbi:MAG: cytochrome P460 family protein [Methylocella sp.]
MKLALLATLILTFGCALLAAAPEETSPKPQYDAKDQLVRPEDYRDWVFLSSGYGMNYSPSPGSRELFTNVFVPRWAYQEFLSSGKWPEQTTWVVEERGAESKGSINKLGHFQTDWIGLAVEVKDSSRFPDKWGYFSFGGNDKSSEAMPIGNGCWSCHEEHAAVEHTFVQFYPTLKPVAKKFGVYNEAREQSTDSK